MNRKKKCYWCGGRHSSDEHTPPKNLFPPDVRGNLITVPSCRKHNEDFHQLDERFRVYLQGASGSEIAARLFSDKTMRSLTRAPGFRKSIMDAAQPARLDGEDTFALSITGEHHDAYFEKIARALYFHHFGEPFPGEIKAACSHFHLRSVDFRELIKIYHSVKSSLQPGQVTDPRVFRYEFGRVVETQGVGYFLHATFYEDITVFAFGAPRSSLRHRIARWFARVLRRLRAMRQSYRRG